ncbi:uncharacterized protein [Rutidosis leptorrhynchoides]|uniref:uncharacterized protein n=1 Tax=Rutidosis leptorrhynchoides TaxID=125765 RepID=UPI003A999442
MEMENGDVLCVVIEDGDDEEGVATWSINLEDDSEEESEDDDNSSIPSQIMEDKGAEYDLEGDHLNCNEEDVHEENVFVQEEDNEQPTQMENNGDSADEVQQVHKEQQFSGSSSIHSKRGYDSAPQFRYESFGSWAKCDLQSVIKVGAKLLSVNIRGSKKRRKRDWIKEMCFANNVCFLGVQETKMVTLDLFRVKTFWGNYAFDFACSLSRGRSGGILSVWDPNYFVKERILCDDNFVIVKGKWVNVNDSVYMLNIYGLQTKNAKAALGKIIGVRKADERFGSLFNPVEANNFNSFISNTSFLDVPLCGRRFTWINKAASKMSRIDRVLVSRNVMDIFLDLQLNVLPRIHYDHFPLMLHGSKVDCGPLPFKFFHSWMHMNGFDDMIKKVVEDNDYKEKTSVHDKFKVLKGEVKSWVAICRSANKPRLNVASEQLANLELKVDAGFTTEGDFKERLDILKENDSIQALDDQDVMQKSKVKWNVECDENTKFFHDLLKQDEDNLRFQGNVSEEEIKVAVWSCGSEKFSGPDGFTFGFIKKFWEVLKADVISSIQTAFAECSLPYGAALAFICLIPKLSNPMCIRDYRPILLIGFQYKIITKILANRMALVIDKVIRKEQSAFIKGRQILDGSLIISELLNFYKKKKKKLMILKVDFEKAYDRVSWEFLDRMLSILGFGSRWRA